MKDLENILYNPSDLLDLVFHKYFQRVVAKEDLIFRYQLKNSNGGNNEVNNKIGDKEDKTNDKNEKITIIEKQFKDIYQLYFFINVLMSYEVYRNCLKLDYSSWYSDRIDRIKMNITKENNLINVINSMSVESMVDVLEFSTFFLREIESHNSIGLSNYINSKIDSQGIKNDIQAIEDVSNDVQTIQNNKIDIKKINSLFLAYSLSYFLLITSDIFYFESHDYFRSNYFDVYFDSLLLNLYSYEDNFIKHYYSEFNKSQNKIRDLIKMCQAHS